MFVGFNSSMIYAQSNACSVVGGGVGYSEIVNKLAIQYVTANDYGELKKYVDEGQRYIYVPGDVVIKIPNQNNALSIKKNQTIFSDRGINNSAGGTLKIDYINNDENKYPVITVDSAARITGLRIEGPYQKSDTNNKTIGLQFVPNSSGIVIDNNEIFGWPWAAVSIKQSTDNIVAGNYIHHNIKSELGYGVVVQNGYATAEIRCNVFDSNRHAIAGSGSAGEGYYAHHNLVLNGGGKDAYHQFDMHANGKIAGKFVDIRDNWFDYGRYGTNNRSSIVIRGIPTDGSILVLNNFFSQDYYVGSQTAVAGVDGSIPSKEEILTTNSFNIPMLYERSNNLCFLAFANSLQNINCDVLGGI